MTYIIDFLKSEGFLCMLITFMICTFLGAWTGFVVTLIMWVCNLFYIRKFSLYNTIGFTAGYLLGLLGKMV